MYVKSSLFLKIFLNSFLIWSTSLGNLYSKMNIGDILLNFDIFSKCLIFTLIQELLLSKNHYSHGPEVWSAAGGKSSASSFSFSGFFPPFLFSFSIWRLIGFLFHPWNLQIYQDNCLVMNPFSIILHSIWWTLLQWRCKSQWNLLFLWLITLKKKKKFSTILLHSYLLEHLSLFLFFIISIIVFFARCSGGISCVFCFISEMITFWFFYCFCWDL